MSGGLGVLYGSEWSLTLQPYVETVPRCIFHAKFDPTVMFHANVELLTITWNFARRHFIVTRDTRLYKAHHRRVGVPAGPAGRGALQVNRLASVLWILEPFNAGFRQLKGYSLPPAPPIAQLQGAFMLQPLAASASAMASRRTFAILAWTDIVLGHHFSSSPAA